MKQVFMLMMTVAAVIVGFQAVYYSDYVELIIALIEAALIVPTGYFIDWLANDSRNNLED